MVMQATQETEERGSKFKVCLGNWVKPCLKMKSKNGWACSSVMACLPHVQKDLGSISDKKKGKEQLGQ